LLELFDGYGTEYQCKQFNRRLQLEDMLPRLCMCCVANPANTEQAAKIGWELWVIRYLFDKGCLGSVDVSFLSLLHLKKRQSRREASSLVIPNKQRVTLSGVFSGVTRRAEPLFSSNGVISRLFGATKLHSFCLYTLWTCFWFIDNDCKGVSLAVVRFHLRRIGSLSVV